jgi:hypothetical protein
MLPLAVHLAAASAWVGGLLALVVHLRRFPDELRRALPRFSAAALMCMLAVGSAGIVEGVVTLRTWTALWDSDRGHPILAKTVALAVLAAIGYAHRKRTLGPAGTGPARPADQPRRRRTPHHGRDHGPGRGPVNHRITPPQGHRTVRDQPDEPDGVANNQIRHSPIL